VTLYAPVALKTHPHDCIGTVRWHENGKVYIEGLNRIYPEDVLVQYRPASIQDRISEWHVKTFGPDEAFDMKRLWRKFYEEADEFKGAFTLLEEEKKEAADVAICLYAWAARRGFDLDEAVKEKFSEVEQRVDQVERDAARGIR